MSRRTRLIVFVVSTPLVAFVLLGGLLGAARTPSQQAVGHLSVFQDVVRLIFGAYVEPVDADKVMDGAMRGLADGLDPSTAFLTPTEVRAIEAKTALPAGDVGLVVSRQYYLKVIGVRDGSPAKRAGLQTGDFLRAINDQPTRELSALEGTRLLHGAVGSKVSLLVLRGSTADPRTIDLVRELPPAARVSTRRLPGGEAYVRVASFESGASAALQAAVTALGAGANSGLILDLRDVADGPLEEGVAAARLFVKSGTIATRTGRAAERVVTTAASGDGAFGMRLVTLVSNGTGAAAEVLAAALTSTHRATLIGEPTAGLVGIQKLVPLPDGYGLWMTTERYVMADGTPIHGRGVRPDVGIEIPAVAFDETPPASDPVLAEGVLQVHKPMPAPSTPSSGGSARQGGDAATGSATRPAPAPEIPKAPAPAPQERR